MKLKMVRLQMVGLKTHLLATVQTLHELGCVQVDDISDSAAISARRLRPGPDMVQRQEDLAYLAARVEGLLALLGIPAPQSNVVGAPGPDWEAGVRNLLDDVNVQVQALVERRVTIQSEQASLPRYEATLRKLLPIVPASAHDPANTSIGVLASRAHIDALDSTAEQVLNVTAGRAEIAAGDVDAVTRAMLIVVPRALAGEVEALLGRGSITRLRLPSGLEHKPPDEAIEALSRRLSAIPAELAHIETELHALSQAWAPQLLQWRACLRSRLEAFALFARLGETDQTFVLAGWTPQRDVARVRQALAASAGDAVVIQVMPLAQAEEALAPVAMVNIAPARPFQSLVRMYDVPSYRGIDPTLLMMVFLPLFFGLILGDAGYGTLLLGLSLLLLKRSKAAGKPGMLRDVLQVVLFGSAWSILFGVLYGEAFGTLGAQLGMRPIWMDRTSPDHVAGLLLFSVGLGAFHVTLGLVLGVWEAARERSRLLLLERGGMLVGLIGLFLIVSIAVKWLPAGFMTPGIALLITGIALLGASLGWLGLFMGPIEFIGLVGNILSYVRIAAIGLASVYLARVANELAGATGNIVIGLIIALLIHALNLALGAFSPTIHSLRLHYVEFFRKFYEGGGRPFEPFGGSA